VFRRVRALTCTDPVSRHWRTHWPIIFVEGAAPLCRSSPNFRRNPRCTDTIDLPRTVPHKICAAARTNVPLFTESKATRNPTTVVSDPSHNPHKQYCQLKMGDVKCRRTVPQPIRHDSQWTPYVLHFPGDISLGLVTCSGSPIHRTLL
jgi:hypothetical protein